MDEKDSQCQESTEQVESWKDTISAFLPNFFEYKNDALLKKILDSKMSKKLKIEDYDQIDEYYNAQESFILSDAQRLINITEMKSTPTIAYELQASKLQYALEEIEALKTKLAWKTEDHVQLEGHLADLKAVVEELKINVESLTLEAETLADKYEVVKRDLGMINVEQIQEFSRPVSPNEDSLKPGIKGGFTFM